MNDLIEKLKDKNYVRTFGLMTPEEKECYKKATLSNCLVFANVEWYQAFGNGLRQFDVNYTYAIKPDYQPELEFIKCKIEEYDGYIGIWTENTLLKFPHNFIHLHCVPSMPQFDHFETETKLEISTEDVSRLIKNKIVYAVFRSE